MCCALAWTAQRLRQYLLYHTTWLISKLDPIKYIFEKPSLSKRIAKWQVLFSEYDIQYVSQKMIKGSVIADFLVDQTEEEYEPMKFEFLEEDFLAIFQIEDESTQEDTWKLYFDGASNVLGHGIGVVLISLEGEYYPFTTRLNFDSTSNVTKYEACILGLQVAMAKKVKNLKVYEDLALVICQLQGDWLTRDSRMILYHKLAMKMVDKFEVINFEHLPTRKIRWQMH